MIKLVLSYTSWQSHELLINPWINIILVITSFVFMISILL